jgi:hypothetical protein
MALHNFHAPISLICLDDDFVTIRVAFADGCELPAAFEAWRRLKDVTDHARAHDRRMDIADRVAAQVRHEENFETMDRADWRVAVALHGIV